MDSERLQWALRDALMNAAAQTDPDDLDDIIEFLASECVSSGLHLSLAGEDASSDRLGSHGRTLEDLLAHPLTAIVGPHLVDLLGIEEGQVAILVDDILDAYEDGTWPIPSFSGAFVAKLTGCAHARTRCDSRGARKSERRSQAV